MKLDNFLDIVADKASRLSEKMAFVNLKNGIDEDKALTYGELERVAKSIGAGLQSRSIKGERVILLFPTGSEFISGFLGCIFAGAVAVPAHTPKPNKRSWTTMESIIDDCQPKMILTCRSVREKIIDWSKDSPKVKRLEIMAIEDLLISWDTQAWQDPQLESRDLAFLQYTSGSISLPKGVIVTHENLVHNSKMMCDSFGHDQDSVMISWLPLFHDLGLIGIVLQTLYVGGSCYFISPAVFIGNPVLWLKAISKYRGTTSMSSDFGYRVCYKGIRDEQLKGLDLSCWKNAINAAEPVHAETIHGFNQRFAAYGLPETTLCPSYGMAETTLLSTLGRHDEKAVIVSADSRDLENGKLTVVDSEHPYAQEIVSSGRVCDDMEVLIVDPETELTCVDGELGEVWVKGSSVTKGYYTHTSDGVHQQQTADGSHMGYFRTGDLAFCRQGEIFIFGRLKDLIISRGRNIYPQDIELTVKESHAAFNTVNGAVFSIEHDGNEEVVVVHEIERVMRKSADLDKLSKVVKEAIFRDHEVRALEVVFISPASLAKTTSGKVQRRLSKMLYLEGELAVLKRQKPSLQYYGRDRKNSPQLSDFLHNKLGLGANSEAGTQNSSHDDYDADAITRDHIDWFREYAETRINSLSIDERRTIPPYIAMDVGNRGLMGTLVPREYGGQDLGFTNTLKIIEQISACDLAVSHMILVHSVLGTLPIIYGGSESLKQEVLPNLASGREFAAFGLSEPYAGSNPKAIRSTAVPCGANKWRLNGHKCYSGHASWAGVISVFATDMNAEGEPSGISGYMLRQSDKGLHQGFEHPTLGMRGMVQNHFSMQDLVLDETRRLGKSGQAMDVAQRSMTATRLPIAVAAVGAMKRCIQLIHRYADRREISTGRLLNNPATVLYSKEIIFQVLTLETLIYGIARFTDAGMRPPIDIFHVAKIAAPEYLWNAVDKLIQLLGGRGYTENNIAPQMLRDARVMRIFEGPTETLQAHLGAKAFNDPQALDQFIRVLLQQPGYANQLQQTIGELREQLTNTGQSPFNDPLDTQRWMHSRTSDYICQLVMEAFLAWSTSAKANRNYNQVMQWSGIKLQTAHHELFNRNALELSTFLSSDIKTALSDFQVDIGDIELSLPGMELDLDSILRRVEVPVNAKGRHKPTESSNHSPAAVSAEVTTTKSTAQVKSEIKVDTVTAVQSQVTATSTVTTTTPDDLGKWLISTVAGLMNVSKDYLNKDESFGAMGIDSVTSAQLVTVINDQFNLSFDPTIFWHYTTPAKLAGYLCNKIEGNTPIVTSDVEPKVAPVTQLAIEQPPEPATVENLPTDNQTDELLSLLQAELNDLNA